jgi:hypothetical protein
MQDNFICKSYDFAPDVTNITFKPAGGGFNQKGGIGSAPIMYRGGNINIQTHPLVSAFGYSDGQGQMYKADPSLTFNLKRNNTQDRAFMEGLTKLEDLIVQTAYDKRVEWNLFGNNRNADKATIADVRAKFVPILRRDKDDKYPPSFKVSFNTKRESGLILTECVNENGDKIIPSVATMPKRSKNVLDLQAKCVWISGDGKFGLKFKMQKVQVFPEDEEQARRVNDEEDDDTTILGSVQKDRPKLGSGKCLLKDDSDEDD